MILGRLKKYFTYKKKEKVFHITLVEWPISKIVFLLNMKKGICVK